MYVKILDRADKQVHLICGVSGLEFSRFVRTLGELKSTVEHADLAVLDNRWGEAAWWLDVVNNPVASFLIGPDVETAHVDRDDPDTLVGKLHIMLESGKYTMVMFDTVAFLCNETGKAVERFTLRG